MFARSKQIFAMQTLQRNFDAAQPQRTHLALQRLLAGIFVVALTVACTETATAQSRSKSGSSSRAHRTEAIRAIPFQQMNKAAGRRIQSVVKNPSFYRRLPVERIDADEEHFRFLVRKPEVIVSIWQLMGVTQMTAERTAPYSIKTNDGAGTISDLELVYGNDNLHIFYGTGSYTGSLIKQKLTGRCVIVLQTRPQRSNTGTSLTNQLDIFLKVDNAAAALVTRTIQPLVGTTADHNFVESLKFVQRLNDSTQSNGPGVKEMGKRLRIDESVRQEYFAVIDQVFEKEYLRKYGSRPKSIRDKQKIAKTSKASAAKSTRSVAPPTAAPQPTLNRQPLSRPAATRVQQVTVGDPAAHFVSGSSTTQAETSSHQLEGISVLVGGPRQPLNAPTSQRRSTAVRLTDQTSGPVARSARQLPPIVAGPDVNPTAFRKLNESRYIPVHKFPR
jgi:hypothetical protein